MLTQIKNAQTRGKSEMVLPFSRIKFEIAGILKNKGFINNVDKRKRKTKKSEFDMLAVELKYKDSVGAIEGIKLISKPSRRMYAGKKDLRPVKSGYGISVVSTSKGIMAGEDARKAGLGGEILFEIW